MTCKSTEWKTQISYYTDDNVIVRGYSIGDLIDSIDFGSMVYLLLKGELPTSNEAKMINALLVSTADHGISPSQLVTRHVSAAGSPLQASIAAGILTIGNHHGGAVEQVAELLSESIKEARQGLKTIEQLAGEIVAEKLSKRQHVDGLGHPDHPYGDPRSRKLFSLAKELGIQRDHCQLMLAMEAELEKQIGKRIPVNVDGTFGAILLDMGFDWKAVRGFIIISRVAGLLAHAYEELTEGRVWRRAPKSTYLGVPLRSIR